jgi:hypothetical protein
MTVHDQGAGGSGPPFSLPVPADQGLNRFLPHPFLLPLAKVVVDGGPVGQVRNVRLRRDGAWLARGCRSSGRNVLPLQGNTFWMAFMISLLDTLAGRPPGLGAGMRGSRRAHSSSVRSLG